ncbi:MAG: endonuclease domain-containing protein [Nitrospirota bacterium]
MSHPRARQLRSSLTPAEQALWRQLRLRQVDGFKFRRQQPLGPYVVDFACLEARLIVEVDGGHHLSAREYDAERSEWLQSQNFRVLRFWNHEVLTETEGVIGVIEHALNTSPHLSPPPQGGRKRKATGFEASTPSPLAGEGRDGG